MKRKIGFLALVLGLNACESQEELKLKQYKIDGQALYEKHCANCHQLDGTGLRGLYPPLAKSDYLTEANKKAIARSMKEGKSDSITVNGQVYKQAMPANAALEALDIAEITTYIYTEWGGDKKITDVKQVMGYKF